MNRQLARCAALLIGHCIASVGFSAQPTGELFPDATGNRPDKPAVQTPLPREKNPTVASANESSTLQPLPTSTKIPAPAVAALNESMKLVNEAYKDELAAAKNSDQKSLLARKLLDVTADEKDTDNRFAILLKARTVAIDAGNAEIAAEAIGKINDSFQIDELKFRADALSALAKTAATPEQRLALLTQACTLVDLAVQADRYDVARVAGEIAASNSLGLADPALKRMATDKALWEREVEAGFSVAKPAAAVLDTKPDDADANLKLGKFRCFLKGDWDKGLPLLAKSADETLKGAAAIELAGVGDADHQAAIGDVWWAQSEKSSGMTRRNMQLHAAKWYQDAVKSLTGLAKIRIQKRLDSMDKPPPDSAVELAVKPQVKVMTAKEFNADFAKHFPIGNDLARGGDATSSSHYEDRLPQNVFNGSRTGSSWSLASPKGFFEAQWKKLTGRYIILFVRTSGDGKDPWGDAKMAVNDRTTIKLPDVSGNHVILVDLGQEAPIDKLRLDIDGKTYPGLAGIEIFRSAAK